MSADDLISSFSFHDSILKKLYFRENSLIINIDLCMYNQKGYKEGDPELKEMILEFSDITDFEWENRRKLDCPEILKFSCENDRIKIVLLDGEISVITFKVNGNSNLTVAKSKKFNNNLPNG